MLVAVRPSVSVATLSMVSVATSLVSSTIGFSRTPLTKVW